MPVITPAISTSSTPGIEITTSVPGLSYQGLINSLGAICFKIERLFYASQMMSQFSNPMTYTKYDNYGNANGKVISTPISPSQFQSTMYLELKSRGVVFDANSDLAFVLAALNSIQFIFYAETINVTNALNHNSGSIDNFKSVERSMGKAGFFDTVSQEIDQPDIVFIPESKEEEAVLRMVGIPIAKKIPTQTFLLNITNNTSGNVPIILMQQGNPMTNIINATTRYEWDITGVSLTNPNVTLLYRTVGNTGAYNIAFTTLQASTSDGLISALNAIGIGLFWLETSGPNTYIVTWNNNVQYSDLTLGTGYILMFTLTFDIQVSQTTIITLISVGVITGYVDWGDGNMSSFSQSGAFDLTHDYAIGSVYVATFYSTDPTLLGKIDAGDEQIIAIDGLSVVLNVTVLNLNDNAIAILDISGNSALQGINISNNVLPASEINAALIALDGFGSLGGTFNSAGQTPPAPPSGAGAAAALSLQGKGWTVVTD